MKQLLFSILLLFAANLLSGQNFIYWSDTEDDNIYKKGINNGEKQVAVGFQNTPRGLVIDYFKGKIYFANGEDFSISVAEEGNLYTSLVHWLAVPIDVCLDLENQMLYFTDQGGIYGYIYRMDTNGNNLEELISGVIKPSFIDIDALNQKLYFSETDGEESTIYKTDLDGSNMIPIVENRGKLTGLVVDQLYNNIFWLERGSEYGLYKADLDGQNIIKVSNTSSINYALEFDNINGVLYWGEKDNSRIMRMILGARSTPEVFEDNVAEISGIAIDLKNACKSYETVFDTVFHEITITDTLWVIDSILIYDTITVYDTITLYDTIAVEDTLIIDVEFTNVDNLELINQIKVYPNPTREFLNIDCGQYYEELNDYSIKIFSVTGQSIFDTKMEDPKYQLNLKDLFGEEGLYYLVVENETGVVVQTKKIILQ